MFEHMHITDTRTKHRTLFAALCGVAFAVAAMGIFFSMPGESHAQTATELQKQIDAQNAELAKVNKEIAQYEAQLAATSAKKNTLQTKLNGIITSLKKTAANITATKNKLTTTQLELKKLAGSISTTQSLISRTKAGLGESLRLMYMADRRSLVASVLAAGDISDAWQEVDQTAVIQDAVKSHAAELSDQEAQLTEAHKETDAQKQTLESQQKKLLEQQGSMNATKKAQDELIAQTREQEAAYQKLIAQKQAEKKDFEDTLRLLQSKLKSADVLTAPSAGPGVLSWPLESVKITQPFGDTAFSRTAAYKGSGHNGIDLSTKTPDNPTGIGTPVLAALSGSIKAINLGAVPNCQYGKWVLIEHGNGLTTLYAHLSSVQVSQGQSVTTGQIIGYSGDTGYATGPHLHFTVYVSSAVSFVQYACKSGKLVSVPISPFNGYLNPLNYLPAN